MRKLIVLLLALVPVLAVRAESGLDAETLNRLEAALTSAAWGVRFPFTPLPVFSEVLWHPS